MIDFLFETKSKVVCFIKGPGNEVDWKRPVSFTKFVLIRAEPHAQIESKGNPWIDFLMIIMVGGIAHGRVRTMDMQTDIWLDIVINSEIQQKKILPKYYYHEIQPVPRVS